MQGVPEFISRLLLILKQATKEVPAVKYATGLVGVAATAAIIAGIVKGYSSVSILAVAFLILGMVVLYLFAMLARSTTKSTHYAGLALMWAVVLLVIIFMGFTTTAVAFDWPCNWAAILQLHDACRVEPPTSVHQGWTVTDSNIEAGCDFMNLGPNTAIPPVDMHGSNIKAGRAIIEQQGGKPETPCTPRISPDMQSQINKFIGLQNLNPGKEKQPQN